MKSTLLLAGFTLISIALKAQTQEGVTEMKVTDELRKRFALEIQQQPDPSQISYETPPQLLKRRDVTLQEPDPSQVSYETPPALLKKKLVSIPAQPADQTVK